jgi:hypothetical protein
MTDIHRDNRTSDTTSLYAGISENGALLDNLGLLSNNVTLADNQQEIPIFMQLPDDKSLQLKDAIHSVVKGMEGHADQHEILAALERAILEYREAQARCLAIVEVLERRCKN